MSYTRLPDEIAQLPQALGPVHSLEDPEAVRGDRRAAAVLALLFIRRGTTHVLLTERPSHLRNHAGQISLPGGRTEPNDADMWSTAVRETHEELGINSDDICALGRLSTLEVAVSRFVVTPFVGWVGGELQLHVNQQEVASVIEVSISELIDHRSVTEEIRTIRGRRWKITAYRFGGHVVWGATARILADLQARITGIPLRAGSSPGAVREI